MVVTGRPTEMRRLLIWCFMHPSRGYSPSILASRDWRSPAGSAFSGHRDSYRSAIGKEKSLNSRPWFSVICCEDCHCVRRDGGGELADLSFFSVNVRFWQCIVAAGNCLFAVYYQQCDLPVCGPSAQTQRSGAHSKCGLNAAVDLLPWTHCAPAH